MSNDPRNNKLSSQFSGIIGPSDAELSAIEDEMTGGNPLTESESRAASEAGAYFTPERIEESRAAFAKIDPEYAAVRRARERNAASIPTSSTFEDIGERFRQPEFETGSDYGLSDLNTQIETAANEEALLKSGEVSSGEGGATTAFSEGEAYEGRGRRYGAVGIGGWDVDAGRRASPFDVHAPRTPMEKLQREIGNWYLHLAGPTCNHVRCRAIRARGLELIGRPVVERRFATTDPERIGMAFAEPIPSVRKDTSVPVAKVRPEAKGKAHKVGSYGTGKTNDMGDFEMDRKNPTIIPQYEPADPKNPRWVALTKEWKANSGRGPDVTPMFHPDEYLEHHHYPGEEFEPLPWEE